MRIHKRITTFPIIAFASLLLLAGGCSGSEAEAAADEAETAHECGAGGEHDHDKAEKADHADCGCGDTCTREHGEEKAAVTLPEGSEWTTLTVSGMTCGGCEARVREALGELEAILALDADAQTGEVKVALADEHELDDLLTDLGEKVETLGFSLD